MIIILQKRLFALKNKINEETMICKTKVLKLLIEELFRQAAPKKTEIKDVFKSLNAVRVFN